MHLYLPPIVRPVCLRSAGLVAVIIAATLLAPNAAFAKKTVPICTPQVPCSDPRGCPDLDLDPGILRGLIIDIHTFAATDCAVVEGMATAYTNNSIAALIRIQNKKATYQGAM